MAKKLLYLAGGTVYFCSGGLVGGISMDFLQLIAAVFGGGPGAHLVLFNDAEVFFYRPGGSFQLAYTVVPECHLLTRGERDAQC